MDKYFQDSFRVDMGNKKGLSKQEALQKNREERLRRTEQKALNENVVLVQKYLRGRQSNIRLLNQILLCP